MLEVLEVLEVPGAGDRGDSTLKTALNLLWTAFNAFEMPSRVKCIRFVHRLL